VLAHAGNPNTYQIICSFEGSGSTWSAEIVVDHTAQALASTRPRLLEQSDLYVYASDGVHIIYKEYLAADGGTTSSIKHVTGPHGVVDDRHDRPRCAQPQLVEDYRGRWDQVSDRIEPRPVVLDERGRHRVPVG